MKIFKTFFFDGYSFDPETLKASFFYSFDHEIAFTETIDFSCPGFVPIQTLDPQVIDTLLFHMSLAVGISYYKLCPTSDLVIEKGSLNEDQQNFWHIFYTQGLGEFFFKNGLSPKRDLNFTGGSPQAPQHIFSSSSGRPMVALGGGKDSLVSVELTKKLNISFYTSTFGKDYHLHTIVGDSVGAPRLVIQRTLDPKLFEMNQQGYYNGHVPISGIIAFALVFGAYLYDYQYIVMSNEKSANEGNTVLDGIEINHQRSKSFSFESDFDHYIKAYISPDLHYFSLLRGMYELKIAELFSHYPQYFSTFSSCNNNFKIIEANKTTDQRRCGICPKCAFVYAILRPFLSDEATQKIFGQELYENAQLLPLYQELLGIEGIKPFECVGTNEEVTYAMYLYYEKIKNNGQIPPILQLFATKILPTLSADKLDYLDHKIMTISLQETNIPPLFISLLT